MTTTIERELGWRINKEIIPESKDETKEYKWYQSTGWKLVNKAKVQTNEVDSNGVPVKPEDIPGKVWKLNSKNKWCSHVDMSDRSNKPYCNKKDKDYFWNEKVKAWKLANVVYADKDVKYSFVAPLQNQPIPKVESKQESKVETKVETKVDEQKLRQEQIEKQIDLYYQKKEQELQAKMQQNQQAPIQQVPVQQAPAQQTKVVFDNPLLNKYM
ncbi:Hypothetical_protein [Hexamita inflata]|uniref:Hypothetical_protein n=1 Tax=Hexamita inflata TaxID=28002 RepID=A0AA86PZI7_9EUKA|nr:Hypothetical protein HINF_LOCUS35441 [Hexamita inflata]